MNQRKRREPLKRANAVTSGYFLSAPSRSRLGKVIASCRIKCVDSLEHLGDGWTWILAALGVAIGTWTGCTFSTSPPSAGPLVGLELVVDGLTVPVALVEPDDGTGRLFIVDQVGQIRVVDGQGRLLPTPFLDVSAALVALRAGYDERGLLGLAFHPDYANNGRFFVRYSTPRGDDPGEPCTNFAAGCHTEVLVEYGVSNEDPNVADANSGRVLLAVDQPQSNHNGGQIAFGPEGFLYAGFGDGGGAHDRGAGHTPGIGNGQDNSTLLGKIIRINVDEGDPYGIPPDNPFVNIRGSRPEIWATGLRNPWRFSFDLGDDHRLFVGDVGQNLFEEVNIIRKGGNFGWNIKEGSHCFDPDQPDDPPAACPKVDADGRVLTDPILEYAHPDVAGNGLGTAVIGGYVYRGNAIPALSSVYIFGDYSGSDQTPDGILLVATRTDLGTWTLATLDVEGFSGGRIGHYVLGLGQDNSGEVYVLTTDLSGPAGTTGRVFKLVPVTNEAR